MDHYNTGRDRYVQRRPLEDVSSRANRNHSPMVIDSDPMSSPKMPHHESRRPDGNLNNLTAQYDSPSHNQVENKRLSNVINEFQPPNSNRNSAISTASSNSNKSRRKTHVGPWQLGRTLGKGAIGRVRIARHCQTGQVTAIKIISRNNKKMQPSESLIAMDHNIGIPAGRAGARWMPHGIEREVVIMKLINHPNIMHIFDVWENRGELYLVLEYVQGGELFDYVSSRGKLPEHEAVRLFRQMIAGLSYCHRLGICHRDLKPENILLDKDLNIKLADFGMATLQANGQMLRTSCGSPHYASPEIISGYKYSGAKADIWSVGVILYAMLAGTLPFDCGGDMDALMRSIRKGRYNLQPWFTPEASDLIRRILVVNPNERISMDEIWEHILLKKYERYLYNMFGANIGLRPSPHLTEEECGPRIHSEFDIHADLLRNVQTLWHSTDPKMVLKRLMSEKPTLERLIYNALVRYHEEYLENYVPVPLDHSASDYCHIIRPIPRNISKRYLQDRPQSRSSKRSEFSILSRDKRHRAPRRDSSSVRTIGSYDPYRSSKNQVTAQVSYTNVKVLHNEIQEGNLRGRSRSRGDSICHPAISRLQASEGLRPGSSDGDFDMRSSHTRSTLNSYNGTVQSRRASYKRNVSFRHIRHRSVDARSAASARPSVSEYSFIPEIPTRTSSLDAPALYDPEVYSSPELPSPPVRYSSVAQPETGDRIGVRRVRADTRPSSIFWKEEARKVSTELGKICEEAFNRSSMSSGAPSVSHTEPVDYQTPHTSFSEQDDRGSIQQEVSRGRALPQTPSGNAEDVAIKELAATRRRLLEHCTHTGDPARFEDVIRHLDRMLEYKVANNQQGDNDRNRRAASDPNPKQVPGIRVQEPSGGKRSNGSPRNWDRVYEDSPSRRVVSEPTKRTRTLASQETIRVVAPEDISALPKLPQEAGTPSGYDQISSQRMKILPSADRPVEMLPHSSLFGNGVANHTLAPEATVTGHRFATDLEPIQESPLKHGHEPVEKKRSWFRKKSQSFEGGSKSPTKENFSSTSSRERSNGPIVNYNQVAPSQASTTPPEKKPTGSRNVFKKMFKKSQPKLGLQVTANGQDAWETESVVSPGRMGEFDFSSRLPVERSIRNLPARQIQPEQNWFARMLHIKPASRVLCLNIARPKARREIFRILKEWRKYGLSNLHANRQSNLIFGSVAAKNFLGMKSVEFAAELFVVLQHGRHANLSIAQFTQERGAASSFYKVVDTLQLVLRERGLLVEDPVKVKKMAKMIPK